MINRLAGLLTTRVPLGDVVEWIVDFLKSSFRDFFRSISSFLDEVLRQLEAMLLYVNPYILIVFVGVLSWWLIRRNTGNKHALFIGVLGAVGLALIDNMGLWRHTMSTLSMVLTATGISILIGIPTGIWAAKSRAAHRIVMPVMDFMQTMPAFVYLIPAISFFGLGMVPGVVATVIFSIPPAIRLTSLGISQVPQEITEAADAFGSTDMQKLFKVQLPLALPTIMAGINQTIMLSLSMVVIASMIGAPGLGQEVWRGIQRLQVGSSFEAGISVVILAMILDRITQNIVSGNKK